MQENKDYVPEDDDRDDGDDRDETEDSQLLVESEDPLFTVEEADETNSSDDKKKSKKGKVKINRPQENVRMEEFIFLRTNYKELDIILDMDSYMTFFFRLYLEMTLHISVSYVQMRRESRGMRKLL